MSPEPDEPTSTQTPTEDAATTAAAPASSGKSPDRPYWSPNEGVPKS